ncbi:MAG: DUF1580 domain-containing protein [Planctomycetes bacterium]|nr:DUF1580 domain-containing protein [Planctomycetota bacterium]
MVVTERSRALPALFEYIALTEVPPLLPQPHGRPIHKATVIRWATTGCSGVRLRTVCLGRIRCTTQAWLTEFGEQVEAAHLQRQLEERGRGG